MERRNTAQNLPIVWALLIGLGPCCPCLSAQPVKKHSSKGEPSTAFTRRIVKTFDFNEKPLGNLEDAPMNWDKVTESGYTHYINGRIDDTQGHPRPSFKLQLNGGNLAYVFSERLIPAFPGSDHKIIAYVKTQNLKNARGYIQGFYMDRSGKMLGNTLVYSELIGPPVPEDPEWRLITLDLPFTNSEGRFIGLGVFLVQEDQLPAAYTIPIRSYRKDIDAALWLDEITVLRLPKVRLKLMKELPVYGTAEPIALGATVADSKIDDLSARITLRDLANDTTRSIAQSVAVLPPLEAILRGLRTAPGLLPHDLGTLLPGLYRISLEVLSSREVIITKTVTIAVLNHPRPAYPGSDLGVDLSSTRFLRPDLLAAFVGQLRPAWAILPLWRQDLPVSRKSSEQSAAEQMILQINHQGVSVVGAFLEVPEELAGRIRILNPSLWDLLAGNPDAWQFDLSTILSRHADRIDRWIFGKVPDCWQAPDPRIGPTLQALKKEFSQFQGQYSLMAPWPAMVDPPTDRPADGYAVTVPPELVSGSFPDYFKAWGSRIRDLYAILPGPDLAQVQSRPAMRDFVMRFIKAKCAGVRRLAAQNLWTAPGGIGPEGLEPTVYYPAYANLIDHLGGMDYLGEIAIAPDRSGLLFGSAERTSLILTDAREEPYRGVVTLGDHLKAYDMWGRALPITQEPGGWEIAYRPIVFLDGIDPDLARFIASIQFDPPLVPSRFGSHPVKLIFKNTFPQGLSGMVHVQGPPSWQFDPSGSRLALPMGKEFSLPMKLRYPSSEPIGAKSLLLRFELEAKKPVRLSVLLPVALGVSDLQMRVIWFVRNGEMIVQQEVVNNGTTWTDLMAFAIAPDRPRMERQIRRLGPHQTATKEYSLGPWQQAMGQTIRVGFREVRGTRLANETVTLE